MDLSEIYVRASHWVSPRILAKVTDVARAIPLVRRQIEREYGKLALEMEKMLKPYRGACPEYTELPERGAAPREILAEMAELNAIEEPRWRDGFASGSVYHGDEGHILFMNEVYSANSQSNPLHSDLWPSSTKYEAEIISMTARMLGAGRPCREGSAPLKACGVVTSGGTESIMLAMKAYRDWAREERKISRPEMVVPSTAHPAFDKAAHFFDIKIRRVPVGRDFRADVEATRRALSHHTAVIVGSAPSFPHGVIDPIEGLSELARERGIGLHTDACLGGFILPWAEELGYDVPAFDFRLPGVTSISVDTHKYGYAPKGTSVILYRDRALRQHQYFMTTEWPGGIYFTPTFAGSRPGALSAACWAALVSTGKHGYREATRSILQAAEAVKRGIKAIPGLRVLGDPLWDISFTSDEADIYEVLQFMTERKWSLNGLQKPPAVHICLTLRHTRPGVTERFLYDLREAVEDARSRPEGGRNKTAMYGMAATFPDRRLVKEALNIYLDTLYEA
jgi:sphinganine-1-phosphate aldolase